MTTDLIHPTISSIVEAVGNHTPMVLAIGDDDGRCLYVHFKPLTDEQLRSYDQWAGNADLTIFVSEALSLQDIKEAIITKWPTVRYLGFCCTCCSSEDLIYLNGCGYCGQLDEHTEGCPLLTPFDGDPHLIPIDHPQMEAHRLYERGFRVGRDGHRCGENSASGKLGYRKGREFRKNHPQFRS